MTVQALRMEEFVPALATPEQWAAVRRYWRRLENGSDAAAARGDDADGQALRGNRFACERFFGFLLEDTVVSGFAASWPSPAAPDYATRKHLIFAHAEVLREFRRQGIGRRWLPKLRELAGKAGATSITFNTAEEDGHLFLRRIGARLKTQVLENRLDFDEIDWSLVARWKAQGKQRSPETTLEFYEGHIPETMWDEISRAFTEISNDQPHDDLDVGTFSVTHETLRERHAGLEASNGELHTFVTRERDGMLSSYTSVMYVPRRPRLVAQLGTGTMRQYRGRGLAKWVKAESLEYVRRRYPDTKWILTGNGTSNAPMLAINLALGFKEYKGSASYQMSVETLDRAMATLKI